MDNDKLDKIRIKMKEKRKEAARLAGMNGSWNKSFGKKRRCPNVSVILKASLKSNNRALAKSLQTLKQENRYAQDMIIDLQNEQQVLMQKVYQMKQNEKENMRVRKEIQTSLNDVTSSLLTAGTKLAYAMELTTSFPIRESLLRSSSVALSSDDDSLCMINRPSSIGPSVYYRKSKSAAGLTPVLLVHEALQANSNSDPLPSPIPSILSHQHTDVGVLETNDVVAMETNEEFPEDPECLDPSMIKELDFDIPLMFTDDELPGKVDVDKPDEDVHSIKRRTRTPRTSGLINLASSSTNPAGSRCAPTPSARGTFVVEHIKEDKETNSNQSSAQEDANQQSNILNQTFEIGDKSAEKIKCDEKSRAEGEKTSHKVVDMELTMSETNELCSSHRSKNEPPVENESGKKDNKSQKDEKAKVKVSKSKNKSKLPLKKAKTKVSLKKKDLQETFQSPKSPLMSPGIARSKNGLSFRCVPSPVFGKASKREHVPSKSHLKDRANVSVTSVFDLSEGDTFSEAKSVLMSPGHEPVILECSDNNMDVNDEDLSAEKKKSGNTENHQVDVAEQPKPSKSKLSRGKRKTFNVKDEKISTNTSTAKREHKDSIKEVETEVNNQDETTSKRDDAEPVAMKIRKSRRSKTAAVGKGNNSNAKYQESNEVITNNHKKEGKKRSLYNPNEEAEASLFFITKPTLHKKKKEDKGSTSGEKETLRASDDVSKTILADFLQDIDSIINTNGKNDQKKGKRKKKRSSIPILQNKSVMAARLDALMMPLDDKPKISQQCNEATSKNNNSNPEHCSDNIDGHDKVTHAEQGRDNLNEHNDNVNKDVQGGDIKDTHGESVTQTAQGSDEISRKSETIETEQDSGDINSETNKQEQNTKRTRRSSVISPEIQAVAKSRKRRCIMESDSEETEDELKPTMQKKSSTAKERKRYRVSFDQDVKCDGAAETGRQRPKRNSRNVAEKRINAFVQNEQQDMAVIEETEVKKAVKRGDIQASKKKIQAYETDEQQNLKVIEETEVQKVVKNNKTQTSKKSIQVSEADEQQILTVTEKTGVKKAIKKGKVRNSKKAAKVTEAEQQNLRAIEKSEVEEASKKDQSSEKRTQKTVPESDKDDDEIVDNKKLKKCIKKGGRSSGSKSKVERIRNSTEETEKASAEQSGSLGGRRGSRRAAGVVSYKEPSLGGKLRRGDPHTSNDFLTSADIYKAPLEEKKIIKAKVEKRAPLSNVQNTIVMEEIECGQEH